MNLHVRALPTADTTAVLRAVRGEVRRIDPALPVLAAKTLRYHVATNIEVWVIRAGAWLFGQVHRHRVSAPWRGSPREELSRSTRVHRFGGA